MSRAHGCAGATMPTMYEFEFLKQDKHIETNY